MNHSYVMETTVFRARAADDFSPIVEVLYTGITLGAIVSHILSTGFSSSNTLSI